MEWIPVGKVLSTQGVRGEVKFHYYNEAKEDVLHYASLFVGKVGEKSEIRPAHVRFQNGFVFIRFKGIESLDEVSFLVGQELYVRERDLISLEEGEYYEYQLIGLDVVDMKDNKIGVVESVLHTGANDVLVIGGNDTPMVPLVEGFVIEVNVRGGYVRVDGEAIGL